MTVENCTFKANVVTGLLIYVDFRDYVLQSPTSNNKDRVLDETTWNHLTIKNCVFIANSAAGLVRVLIGTQMINVLMQGLVVEHSVAKESLIEVTKTASPSNIDVKGGYGIKTLKDTQGGSGVKLLPRHSRMSASSIINSSWGENAFELVNLAYLSIDKVGIAQSSWFEGDINQFAAYPMMMNSKVYLSRPINFGYSSALCLAAFWTLHFALRRDKGVFRKQWVATLVVLFFLIHPNILRSNFFFFNCTEIQSGEFWLNENLDIRCFDHKPNSIALTVILPVFVIWGLLVPLLVLLYLVRRRRKLSEINMKLRFGFLYNGFKQSKFYWEFVIMFRRIFIICIVVFIGNQSVTIQALTLVLLLLSFLILQYLARPYASTELNEMESRSVLVAAVTIYSGL
jgi:hypothetical protein